MYNFELSLKLKYRFHFVIPENGSLDSAQGQKKNIVRILFKTGNWVRQVF